MRKSKRLVVVSGAGALLLLVALVVTIVSVLDRPSADPSRTGPSEFPSASEQGAAPGSDASLERPLTPDGWVEEPSTSDPREYAEAAFRAVTTFDTRSGSREEWLGHLETWMTPFTFDGQVYEDITELNRNVLRYDATMDADQWQYIAELDGFVEGSIETITGPSTPTDNTVRQEYGFRATVLETVTP
ncbi:hypothetical protein, partial [Microbacterium arborescens]|uniref:hypothetical protein n=1 Tax=Microbacterium arborescens TaxID=33883 RepID=UPI000ACB375F